MAERSSLPAPVDPATPSLTGVHAAVIEERDALDLPVVGDLPTDLRGVYVRNGPNPRFPPIGSWTSPLDGDGMVHGLWFEEDGRVRYRNRFVWNPQLRVEEQAGRALWPGIMTPWLPGPDLVPESMANDYKPIPDINVVRHAGRWLALAEVDPPWELTAALDVVGTTPFTFGGAIPGMCAHPKIDPVTGELVLFRYDLTEPFLTWAVVGADGSVSRPPEPIDVDGVYMIHDFVITATSVVLFVAPAVFDLDALLSGSAPPLSWQPDRGLRIAVIPRDVGVAGIRWIETDPFWVWHFANAYDDGGEIVVDFSRFHRLTIGASDNEGAVCRARLDPAAGTIRLEDRLDEITEFARIDDRAAGQRHAHFTVSAKTSDLGAGDWNRLLRFDAETGACTEWRSTDGVFAEVVFAPATGSPVGTGYHLTYRTDPTTLTSDVVILDASDIASGPVATIPLPFRVPLGLHGNFYPSS